MREHQNRGRTYRRSGNDGRSGCEESVVSGVEGSEGCWRVGLGEDCDEEDEGFWGGGGGRLLGMLCSNLHCEGVREPLFVMQDEDVEWKRSRT